MANIQYEVKIKSSLLRYQYILFIFINFKKPHAIDDKSRCKPGDCGIDRKVKPVPKQINKRTLKVE